MPSRDDSAVAWHPSMPARLETRFMPRTRQWPGSVRMFAFPAGFGLGPVFLLLRGKPIAGAAGLFFWISLGLAAGSGLLVLLLLWRRRGPDFALGDDGVWLRPSPWRRRAAFVSYGRLRDIEVEPLREWNSFHLGALVRLDTVGGPFPRRPRFIPCRRLGYGRLERATASVRLLTEGRATPGRQRTE